MGARLQYTERERQRQADCKLGNSNIVGDSVYREVVEDNHILVDSLILFGGDEGIIYWMSVRCLDCATFPTTLIFNLCLWKYNSMQSLESV